MAIPAVAATAVQSRLGKGKAKAKPNPYNGGSRRNIAPPGEESAPPADGPSAGGADRADGSGSSDDAGSSGEPGGIRRSDPSTSRTGWVEGGARGGSLKDGSGVALGVLLWVWVVLPYLDGGMSRVKAVLAAKLTNTGPDGKPLP